MSYQADATAVAPQETIINQPLVDEMALFQYLDDNECRWAKLSFNRGKYYLKFATKKKLYHFSEGRTIGELLENLQERILRLSA